MNVDEWITQAARVRSIWGRDLDADTVREWYDRLRDLDAAAVRDAISKLAEEPDRKVATVGAIRKVALTVTAVEPRPMPTCTCFDTANGWRNCRSGHPDGWRERMELHEQALSIVAEHPGVDPNIYGPKLGFAISVVQLGLHYAKNYASGRAIDDPGDEHGCPTKGHHAGCVLSSV